MRWPSSLSVGSWVRVIAPASPLPRSSFFAGLAWLRTRYRVRMSSGVLERAGYLAGSDARRRAELQHALDEPDTAAIVLARGGYGITRLLEELEWSTFTRAPKWIVGFSDGTALLTTACAHSVCSLHASNVNGLASAASVDRAAWLDALEGRALVSWDLHATVGQPARSIRGTAFGGNLSLLAALAAHGRLTPPADAVWIVEDVTERPYRLDRMATSLRPFVRNARAVVLGEYVGCEPGPDGISAHQALCAAWGDLGVPLVWGAPSGHGARNAPWPLGAAVCVKLDAGRARIEFRRP